MKTLSPAELKQWMDQNQPFELIDVREEWEHRAFNIGGRLIPLSTLMATFQDLQNEIPLVLYCEKGIRSMIAIQRLEMLGLENLYNLSGGMTGWRKFITH